MKKIATFIILTTISLNIMAQQKIVQTAGRTQLGEFAPEFAHLNDDILFYYCPLNPKTTPLTFRETEVWLSAYHGQAPFVKKSTLEEVLQISRQAYGSDLRLVD